MYKRSTLESGLRLITHHMPGRQSAALGIWITIGGRYENTSKKGISHYLEHMLFKGSRRFSCRQIKESIEGVGGSLNGFTSEELTCYLVKIPAQYLVKGLRILADMVLHPKLPARDVQKEKQVILEEIKMYRDLPQSFVYDLLDDLLWPDQPLGEPVIGTEQSVCAIDRKALVSFQQQYYTPSNIVISAAGNLDHAELLNEITAFFGGLQSYTINVFSQAQEVQTKPKLKISHKDTEQTHLALGFHSFKRDHPLRHALGMLHVALGANMSSRLFNEVRERRGLAYEIGTAIKRYHDTGAFIVHAGIDNRKVAEAITLILHELHKITRQGIGLEEFRRAREYYRGQMMLALEDTLDHMLWLGESVATLNKSYTLAEIMAEVDKVKREDVRKAAGQLFQDSRINCALIGPLKGKERQLMRSLRLE